MLGIGGEFVSSYKMRIYYCGFHVRWRGGFSAIFSITLIFFALALFDLQHLKNSTGSFDSCGVGIVLSTRFD